MAHRIRLDLKIAVSSRWHAGSGEGNLATDRLVRTDARGRPFIPGSTLKGIIRQSCEKLSRTLEWPSSSNPHQLDLAGNAGFVPFHRMASPVDRLFGTKYEPGRLFFRDARLVEEADLITFSRPRVALNRILKTARDKHLFSTEYVGKATLYSAVDGWHQDLTSLGDDYPPFAYCLLVAGILAVERIGGDKSTGAGWLEGGIVIDRAEYNGSALELDDALELLEPGVYEEMREES